MPFHSIFGLTLFLLQSTVWCVKKSYCYFWTVHLNVNIRQFLMPHDDVMWWCGDVTRFSTIVLCHNSDAHKHNMIAKSIQLYIYNSYGYRFDMLQLVEPSKHIPSYILAVTPRRNCTEVIIQNKHVSYVASLQSSAFKCLQSLSSQ